MLAAETPRLQAQVGQQCAGLPGRRQRHCPPVTSDLEVAQKSKFKPCNKYRDYQDNRVLWVQFSEDGVVRELIDLRECEPSGRRGAKGK